MPETVTIMVLFDPGRCSPNLRKHHFQRAGENAIAKETARLAWIDAGRPTLPPPVLVNIIVKRRRRMDEDNLRAALIPLVNGIFKQGIVEDDSPRFLRYDDLRQEKPSPLAHPSVIFEVTSLAEVADES